MTVLLNRLSPDQAPIYFSHWLSENYLLYIDYKQEQIVARFDRHAYHIPLSKNRLAYLEEHIIAVAQAKGCPIEIYNPSGYDSGHEEKLVLQKTNPTMPAGFISNAIWAVHLVCKKNTPHAFLVIECMQSEQHIMQRYELIELPLKASRSFIFLTYSYQ